MIWMEFHPKNLSIYIFYFYVLQGLQQVVVGLSSCSRLYWIFWNMTRVEVYFDDRLILGWFWQGFLHFHETTSLASNENTALKLEDKNEYDAMLEQEYALVQLQNEPLSRNHHFKHKGEDKSGFAVVTITKASKCIPSASPIGFIKCSVFPSRPYEASLSWALMYRSWRRKGRLDSLTLQFLCCKGDLWNWAEVGNAPSRPWIGQTVVMWHNAALKRDIVWTREILSSPLTPPLLQRHIQCSRLALSSLEAPCLQKPKGWKYLEKYSRKCQ